jgi:hypothetical protein
MSSVVLHGLAQAQARAKRITYCGSPGNGKARPITDLEGFLSFVADQGSETLPQRLLDSAQISVTCSRAGGRGIKK